MNIVVRNFSPPIPLDFRGSKAEDHLWKSPAAFRLGHSIRDDIQFLANDGTPVREPLALPDAFFNAPVVSQTGVDPMLKYLARDRAPEIDTKVVDDVRDVSVAVSPKPATPPKPVAPPPGPSQPRPAAPPRTLAFASLAASDLPRTARP